MIFRRVRRTVFRAVKRSRLGFPHVDGHWVATQHGRTVSGRSQATYPWGRDGVWPSHYASRSAQAHPEWPHHAHLHPVLTGVPLSRILGGAVRSGKTPRVRSAQEFLDRSVSEPELLRFSLAREELDVVAWMEELADRVHRDAIVSEDTVSVIMPTRNAFDKQFFYAVTSVLSQTHSSLELLLLDNSGAILADPGVLPDDPRIRLIDAREVVGQGVLRQFGLGHATGEVVAWLDDDDVWDVRNLRIALDQMARRDLVAFYSATLQTDGPVGLSGIGAQFECIRWTPFRRGLIENRNVAGSPSIVHRRLPDDQFRIEVNRFTDWSSLSQLSRIGRVGSLPVILSVYNQFSRSSSVSSLTTADDARGDFRRWQTQRYDAGPSIDGVTTPRYPVSPPATPTASYGCVVVAEAVTPQVRRLVDTLSTSPRQDHSTPGVLVVTGPFGEGGTDGGGVDLGVPWSVLSRPGCGFGEACDEGIRELADRVEAVVVISGALDWLAGSPAGLVEALQGEPAAGVGAAQVLVSPRDKRFAGLWSHQQSDALVDVTVWHRFVNARIATPEQPEESLQLEAALPHCLAFLTSTWRSWPSLASRMTTTERGDTTRPEFFLSATPGEVIRAVSGVMVAIPPARS